MHKSPFAVVSKLVAIAALLLSAIGANAACEAKLDAKLSIPVGLSPQTSYSGNFYKNPKFKVECYEKSVVIAGNKATIASGYLSTGSDPLTGATTIADDWRAFAHRVSSDSHMDMAGVSEADVSSYEFSWSELKAVSRTGQLPVVGMRYVATQKKGTKFPTRLIAVVTVFDKEAQAFNIRWVAFHELVDSPEDLEKKFELVRALARQIAGK